LEGDENNASKDCKKQTKPEAKNQKEKVSNIQYQKNTDSLNDRSLMEAVD